MALHHEHDHKHRLTSASLTRAFVIGIVLNLSFVLVQVVIGFRIHSLSLLSDAGHNFADIGALAISLLAFRLLRVKPSKKYTYGYRKTSVLTALFNAMVLLVSIGAILYEAAHRFWYPEKVPGITIAFVSGIGILINTASALFFLRDKNTDLNVKSAYLHLMSDALVSLALVIGGLVIQFTGFVWIDPLLSILVAIVILISTWRLFRESVRLSLDGVPHGIDWDEIRETVLAIEGVQELHHMHIWAISTSENALTAHLIISKAVPAEQFQLIKQKVKHALEHKHIHHITLETEWEDDPCSATEC